MYNFGELRTVKAPIKQNMVRSCTNPISISIDVGG